MARFLLKAGQEFYRRKDTGRYLYVQESDGPIEVEINGERHTLERGRGVNVPEGFFQVHYTNLHGADQWVTLDISNHIFIDNQLSGEVDIGQWNAGVLPVDGVGGARSGAWDDAKTGPNSSVFSDALDFHVTVQAGAIAASTGCFVAQVLAENGGSASYPRAVLIDEVSAHCDQAGWRLFGYGLISVAFPSGSVTPAAQFMADHGGANDVFPASAGSGNRNWVRSSTSPTVPAGNKADIFRGGAADQLYRHEFKRPIVCERVGTSDYGSRYFAVQNTSGSPALVTMTLRGRVIPS